MRPPAVEITFPGEPDRGVHAFVYEQLGALPDVHRGHLGLMDLTDAVTLTALLPAMVDYIVERTRGLGVERTLGRLLRGLRRDSRTVVVRDPKLEIIIVWDRFADDDADRAVRALTVAKWHETRPGLVFHWNPVTGRWTTASRPGDDVR